MPTRPSEALDGLSLHDDPRLDADFCRFLPGTDATADVLLVGVVHDHPASSYRVAALADAFDPDTLALELPPLAVPGFERASVGENRLDGGEMTAAIAAVSDADVVGIDSLGWRFGRRFLANARRTDADIGTIRQALSEVGRIARHALACRLDRASAGDSAAVDHDISPREPPAAQAEDERTQVARSRSLLGAIERPRADLLVDATREDTMADGIDSERQRGSVLAVVGMNHLETLAEALEASD